MGEGRFLAYFNTAAKYALVETVINQPGEFKVSWERRHRGLGRTSRVRAQSAPRTQVPRARVGGRWHVLSRVACQVERSKREPGTRHRQIAPENASAGEVRDCVRVRCVTKGSQGGIAVQELGPIEVGEMITLPLHLA
jgi:hypothetical protein